MIIGEKKNRIEKKKGKKKGEKREENNRTKKLKHHRKTKQRKKTPENPNVHERPKTSKPQNTHTSHHTHIARKQILSFVRRKNRHHVRTTRDGCRYIFPGILTKTALCYKYVTRQPNFVKKKLCTRLCTSLGRTDSPINLQPHDLQQIFLACTYDLYDLLAHPWRLGSCTICMLSI